MTGHSLACQKNDSSYESIDRDISDNRALRISEIESDCSLGALIMLILCPMIKFKQENVNWKIMLYEEIIYEEFLYEKIIEIEIFHSLQENLDYIEILYL